MQEELSRQLALAHHTTGQVQTAAAQEVERLRNELAKTQAGKGKEKVQGPPPADQPSGSGAPVAQGGQAAAQDTAKSAVAGSSDDVDMDDSGSEEGDEKKAEKDN